jgi:hypothetical protein
MLSCLGREGKRDEEIFLSAIASGTGCRKLNVLSSLNEASR